MSAIRKVPYIETIMSTLSLDEVQEIKEWLNTGGSNESITWATLPEDTIKPVYFQLDKDNFKTGILINTDDIQVLLAYHKYQDMLIYKLDTTNKTYTKVNEYLDINELRRVVDDHINLATDLNSGDAALGDILIANGNGGTNWASPRDVESDEHVVTFDNVTFTDNEVELELSSGDARWTYMQDTTTDCVLVLRLSSGTQVEMRRVHYDTDYVEFGSTLNQEVDGNGLYMSIIYSARFTSSGGKAVIVEFEANKDLSSSSTEYPYLSNITIGGETYYVVDYDMVNEIADNVSELQTTSASLENSVLAIQEQISTGNILVPQSNLAYQFTIPEKLEYNSNIYKRNDNITSGVIDMLGGITTKENDTLIYNSPNSVDITGFNLWDEKKANGYWDVSTGQFVSTISWLAFKNPIRVMANTNYYAYVLNPSTTMQLIFRDINGNVISYLTRLYWNNTTFTTPSNCYDIVVYFNDSFSGNININVSNSSLNGTYKAYAHNNLYTTEISAIKQYLVQQGYDADVLGYGIDKDNCNYIDYVNKKVVINYTSVDLGTLNWTKGGTDNDLFYSTFTDAAYSGTDSTVANILCSNYEARSYSQLNSSKLNGVALRASDTTIRIYDSAKTSLTAAEFKAAMSGVILNIPLATPIEVDISSILDSNLIQPLEEGGVITLDNDNEVAIPSQFSFNCFNIESAIIEGDSDSNVVATNVTLSDEYIHYQQTSSALMFVVAGKLTVSDTISAGTTLLTSTFTIDETAGQYIYPIETDNTSFRIVDTDREVLVTPTSVTTNVDGVSLLEKAVDSNTSMRYRLIAKESIPTGNYVFRYEVYLKL